MSASNAGLGGVKNLRAMFENKATDPSTSPPSRGRSPNGSVSSTQDATLSKVRASFVAVGVERESVHVESASSKGLGGTMDGAAESKMTRGQDLGNILKGSPFSDEEAFPAASTEETGSNGVGERAAAMVMRMHQGPTNPPPVVEGDVEDVGPQINRPIGPPRLHKQPQAGRNEESIDGHPMKQIGPAGKVKGGALKIQGIIDSAARAREANEEAASKVEQPASSPGKAVHSAQPTTTAPEPASTAESPKTATSRKPNEVPTLPVQSVSKSAKEIESQKETVSNESKTKAEIVKAPSTSRAPRMSLPVRKLPTTATAARTSSVAKKDAPSSAGTQVIERKVSKVPSRVANITTTSSLAKKASRTSLNSNEDVKPRTITKPANESFLARMMRPTASSAQKAHEKVQVHSPPRPRQTSGKTLTAKPSRKSLSQVDDNKENESHIPPVPETVSGITSTRSQQAEVNTST